MPCAVSVAIVDPDTFIPQPIGRTGVIAISGQTMMNDYLKNAAADSFFVLPGETHATVVSGHTERTETLLHHWGYGGIGRRWVSLHQEAAPRRSYQ